MSDAESVLKLAMSSVKVNSIADRKIQKLVYCARVVMGLPQLQIDRQVYRIGREPAFKRRSVARQAEQLIAREQSKLNWMIEQAADILMDSDIDLYTLTIRHREEYRNILWQRLLERDPTEQLPTNR